MTWFLRALALLLGALLAAGPAPAQPKGDKLVVADFEAGLIGWETNDAGKQAGRTPDASLVSIAVSNTAHSGQKGLEVRFQPGKGWANVYKVLADARDSWAEIQADELCFWIKGDGSDKHVKIGLQTWADDLAGVTRFEAAVSLEQTEWQQITIPFSLFQQSNPTHPLRLRALISLQVDGSGEIGPARLWLDDITVGNAHGRGARFANGPLDDQISKLSPVRCLPRLGNWGGYDPDRLTSHQIRALGLGFFSNGESCLEQQRAFLAGIAANYVNRCPSFSEIASCLGLKDEDIDRDAQGRRMRDGVQTSIFHPAVLEYYCRHIAEQVRARKEAPWVASFMLRSPVSLYGEVHYAPSTAGRYAVFSKPARENFQRWLKHMYRGDLAALSRAWGQSFEAWEDVSPPDGPRAGAEGIDLRTCWSDFIHWYNWWLEEVTRRSLAAARRETDKPLAVMIGGHKAGFSQGIMLGNVGPIVRLLGKTRPAFLNDTDSQTLFSVKYTRAACSQYGVDLMIENIGPPFLEVFHQYNTVLNALACGADTLHLAHAGQLFDRTHWFSQTWMDLAPLVLRYRTGYVKSDAAVFHSYVTSWYRPSRSNTDAVELYDSTNTLWTPGAGYPSWGRALGSPDVVDDAMVEDGALGGCKLLVIPNSSVTVTSRKAVERIRKWVSAGGVLVGFGPGCLAYTVEPDRTIKATPGMAGLVPQDEIARLQQTEGGGAASRIVRRKFGKGWVVLYLDPADPDCKMPSGKSSAEEAMSLLSAEADHAGVRRWCRADAEHQVNLMYCGRDLKSGRHLFAADFTRYARKGLPNPIFQTDRTFDFTFDPSLVGEAELVGITDSFESCRGGKADFDASARVLAVRFCLPGKLSLTFGKSKSEPARR